MKRGGKELLVVGDRVLVKTEDGEVRTKVGLILPVGAVENEPVQAGRVVALGPGTALPPPAEAADEPWKRNRPEARYLPMEMRVGDQVVFYRKAGVEISFEDERYLVIPQGAILVIVRDQSIPDRLPEDVR